MEPSLNEGDTCEKSTTSSDKGDCNSPLDSMIPSCSICNKETIIVNCDECKLKLCGMCVIGHLKSEHNHMIEDQVSDLPLNNSMCSKHVHCSMPCTVCASLRTASEGTQAHTLTFRNIATLPAMLNMSFICVAVIIGFVSGPIIQWLFDLWRTESSIFVPGVENEDIKVQHKLCEKHIQILIEKLHEIGDTKSELESYVNPYEDAILKVYEWERNISQQVKDKAFELRKQLKEKRNEKQNHIAEKLEVVALKYKNIDKTIAILTNIRKSLNSDILRRELSDSQSFIDELDLYKAEAQPLPPTISVNNLLPFSTTVKDVHKELDKLFTTVSDIVSESTNQNKVLLPVAEWKFTLENAGKDLSVYGENPITLKQVKYGPGPDNEPNGAVILPTPQSQYIAVIDPSDKLRFTKDMTFFVHVYIEGTHVGPLFEYNTKLFDLASDNRRDNRRGTSLWMWPNPQSLDIENCGCDFTVKNVLLPKRWYRIALTFSMPDVKLYVNDKMVHSQSVKADLSQTTLGHIYMGGFIKKRLRGRIASVKFYDIQLTEEEILDLK